MTRKPRRHAYCARAAVRRGSRRAWGSYDVVRCPLIDNCISPDRPQKANLAKVVRTAHTHHSRSTVAIRRCKIGTVVLLRNRGSFFSHRCAGARLALSKTTPRMLFLNKDLRTRRCRRTLKKSQRNVVDCGLAMSCHLSVLGEIAFSATH